MKYDALFITLDNGYLVVTFGDARSQFYTDFSEAEKFYLLNS